MPPKYAKKPMRRKKYKKAKRYPKIRGELKKRSLLGVATHNSDYSQGNSFNSSYPDPTAFVAPDFSVSNFINIPVTCFNRMEQGIGVDKFLGDRVTSKWIDGKFEFRGRPQVVVGNNTHFPKTYLIHGLILAKPSFSQYTTSKRNNVTHTILDDWVVDQLKEYFDTANDTLQFHDKTKKNLKILKYQRLYNDERFDNVQIIPGGDQDPSALTTISRTCRWPINRQIELTEGVGKNIYPSGNEPADPDKGSFYVNNNYIPFCCLYSKIDKSVQGTTVSNNLFMGHNIIHYYCDE